MAHHLVNDNYWLAFTLPQVDEVCVCVCVYEYVYVWVHF